MAKKLTNEELLDELMIGAMSGYATSGPDGTLRNVLKQKPELARLQKEALKRMRDPIKSPPQSRRRTT